MPDRETTKRAQEDAREGKSPSTQAGEFVREEMDHIREGKHGARSTKQAIAIGLSKARRAGVKLPAPGKGQASSETRTKARQHIRKGQSGTTRKTSVRRSRATSAVLKREGRSAASPRSLAKQAHSSAQRRGASARRKAAAKAVRTKARRTRAEAARKAARTRSGAR